MQHFEIEISAADIIVLELENSKYGHGKSFVYNLIPRDYKQNQQLII